jgi:hypothetical protein
LDDSPLIVARALAMVVRSMAESEVGRAEQARQRLAEVTQQIPKELRTLGTDDYPGFLPVADSAVAHDGLIVEVLRREAASRILDSARGSDGS